MQLAFFVNDLDREHPRFATTVLALAALKRGHEISYVTPDDFVCRPDDSLSLHAKRPEKSKYKDVFAFHKSMQAGKFESVELTLADVDILMLRNDPSLDAETRPWAAHAGIVFGQLAAQRGVIVLNDPEGLGQAWNKLYFQTYPAEVRPETLISKSPADIREFVASHKDASILKPLQGSGGKGIFIVDSENRKNLNQIIETIGAEGYIIAQRYLPDATEGDVRLFMMNGQPLQSGGKYAALRRQPAEEDIRSNMHVGGEAVAVELSDDHLRVAELVRPKLCQDGMFLVGLDIIGDKILEINVFSPGGLWSCCELNDTDFGGLIIDAMEKKVAIRDSHLHQFSNRALATL